MLALDAVTREAVLDHRPLDHARRSMALCAVERRVRVVRESEVGARRSRGTPVDPRLHAPVVACRAKGWLRKDGPASAHPGVARRAVGEQRQVLRVIELLKQRAVSRRHRLGTERCRDDRRRGKAHRRFHRDPRVSGMRRMAGCTPRVDVLELKTTVIPRLKRVCDQSSRAASGRSRFSRYRMASAFRNS